MRSTKKGENNPMCASNLRLRKKNTGSQPHAIELEVLDLETNKKTTYPSISAAARALNISIPAISQYFIRNQKKPSKGRYIFRAGSATPQK